MSMNDPLANVLSAIMNAERRGGREVVTKHNSTLLRKVLDLLVAEGYLAGYSVAPASSGDTLTIKLVGKINKVGVVKPRYQIGKSEYVRFEKRFLPARGFGVLLISTNKGLLTHEQAKALGVGGTLISYCY